jgi:hypothetical protein
MFGFFSFAAAPFSTIGFVLIWVQINDNQTPNWVTIDDSQSTTWSAINDANTVVWVQIPT